MASMDDGIQNLQQFNGLLANINSRLTSLSEAFDAFATHLDSLEDAAEQHWNGLEEDLRALIHAADSDADEIAGEITSLGDAAHDLSTSRLTDAEHELERSENGLRDHLHEAGNSLRGSFDELDSRGYDAARTQVDAAADATERVEHDLDRHVADANHGIETSQAHLTSAETDLNHAASDAEAAIDTAESHLEAAAQAARTDETTQQEAAEEAGRVQPHYAELASTASTVAETLHELVTGLGREVVDDLQGSIKDMVEEGVQTGAIEPSERWTNELNALDGVLKEGETETRDLPRLVDDLEISKRKVVELDETLRAMA